MQPAASCRSHRFGGKTLLAFRGRPVEEPPCWNRTVAAIVGLYRPRPMAGSVLCYAPDRLARKFAYHALLIEEFARAGTRVEFVRGPRGDNREDQLMVQFQGMFVEYENEKAQLME